MAPPPIRLNQDDDSKRFFAALDAGEPNSSNKTDARPIVPQNSNTTPGKRAHSTATILVPQGAEYRAVQKGLPAVPSSGDYRSLWPMAVRCWGPGAMAQESTSYSQPMPGIMPVVRRWPSPDAGP